MNKNSPVFFAAFGATLAVLGVLAILFAFCAPVKALAYAVGSTGAPPGTGTGNGPALPSVSQPYDFGTSFENLVSPFTQFFKNMQVNSQAITIAGSGSASPVTITVNTASYVNQFDNWFYRTTGVHIEWVTNIVGGFFTWLFGAANGIVRWIVGVASTSIKAP